MFLKIAVIYILSVGTAFAQFNRGTVIAVSISPQGTTIAADSRNHPTNAPIRDDMCKVRTFGNKFVAAIAGISGHDSSNPVRRWDAFEQLGVVFQNEQPRTSKDFALKWALAMQIIFSRELDYDAGAIRNALPVKGDPSLINGLFVTAGEPRNIILVQVVMKKIDDQYGAAFNFLPPAPPHCTFVCGIGDTETIDEMTVRPTARGQKWRESLSHLKSSDRAIEAVRLTIENHPRRDDVGGDVDAVLVSTHGLKWVRKKGECPTGEN